MGGANRAHHGCLEFEFITVVLLACWQGFGKQSSLCSLFKSGVVHDQALLWGLLQ